MHTVTKLSFAAEKDTFFRAEMLPLLFVYGIFFFILQINSVPVKPECSRWFGDERDGLFGRNKTTTTNNNKEARVVKMKKYTDYELKSVV